MKRFSYLLGQTELFQHFVDIKVCFLHDMFLVIPLTTSLPQKNRDPAFAEMLEAQQAKDSGKGKKAT
jgi:SWI/SNF-related matrix-associated actin-dependent regulator of chromatin subfamily A member 5